MPGGWQHSHQSPEPGDGARQPVKPPPQRSNVCASINVMHVVKVPLPANLPDFGSEQDALLRVAVQSEYRRECKLKLVGRRPRAKFAASTPISSSSPVGFLSVVL